ncbi:MAG: FAD-dependent oxidoreductase [Myxococcales bacterium]|nr:FAD-dependent oxidoreductase [Myxococcales bacterium]
MPQVVIVGAGLTGLSAAYHFEELGFSDYLLVEREDEVGGLARTLELDGFAFDYSIHILYTADPYAGELLQRLLDGNLVRQARRSFCYSRGVYTEYPYQAHTFGLPAEVIADNILGLVEAIYDRDAAAPRNFEEWIERTFGRGIARHFMLPYNRRVWAWDLAEMGFDWIAERVPRPRLEDVILGALQPPTQAYGPNREFWYPERGGIEALPRALAREIPASRLRLETRVTAIDLEAKRLTLDGGETLAYERLISTLPLPRLLALAGARALDDERVRAALRRLQHNVVHTVNIGLRGATLADDALRHWVYLPEERTVFHRISYPHRFSASMAPPGCCSIQAEISTSQKRPLERATLVAQTLEGLVDIGLLDAREARPAAEGGRVLVANIHTLDPAYIIYHLEHRADLATLEAFVAAHDVHSRGRFGQWEYFNMDHSILSGRDAAHALSGSSS